MLLSILVLIILRAKFDKTFNYIYSRGFRFKLFVCYKNSANKNSALQNVSYSPITRVGGVRKIIETLI